MRRNLSRLLVWLYAAALVLMAGAILALLGVLPGVARTQVTGLTNVQAIGLTLALMTLIGLRLFMHLRARHPGREPIADPARTAPADNE